MREYSGAFPTTRSCGGSHTFKWNLNVAATQSKIFNTMDVIKNLANGIFLLRFLLTTVHFVTTKKLALSRDRIPLRK